MTERRSLRRIGPWRLLDLMHATMPGRGIFFAAGAALPEFGPPDPPDRAGDPAAELPGSYISDHERSQAVQREMSRRFVRARRADPGKRGY
ncbi:MAG TPA: hypothetical protein VEZ14_03805 [Dehalococcoidia bacterium]|nr:hypothetical protein [Dehalococcoidia bacterium]